VDQKYFPTIQGLITSASYFALTGKGESPLARTLFGGERISAYGYAKNIQETGQPATNQAHHLAAYILAGASYYPVEFAKEAGRVSDRKNPPDLQLAKIGAKLGEQMKKEQIQPRKIGETIYYHLKTGE
jgi:hypothetical protein